jgi:Domain of unknown function DUF11
MVTCNVPTLASGTTITETLVVNVTAGLGSAIMDTATVSSVTYDPSSGDHSATITTAVIEKGIFSLQGTDSSSMAH